MKQHYHTTLGAASAAAQKQMNQTRIVLTNRKKVLSLSPSRRLMSLEQRIIEKHKRGGKPAGGVRTEESLTGFHNIYGEQSKYLSPNDSPKNLINGSAGIVYAQ